ncbi:MAG: YtxH domain-containing protein [Candidatus Angelobacter sp.]
MTGHARSDEQDWQSVGISSNALGWLLAGIAVGAAAALLLAPSTGRELRHAIAGGFLRMFGSIGNTISQQTRDLRARGSNLLSFSRQAIHKSRQS